MVFVGCSSVLSSLDDGKTELIPGRFYDNYMSPTTGNSVNWLVPADVAYKIKPEFQKFFQTDEC